MSEATPVVWLDSGETRTDAVRALDEWARARGLRLTAPAAEPRVVDASPELGDRIERELERASEAIDAADGETADAALGRAEELLRQHPEILQAAWLRAEVERTRSSRFLRIAPRDEARARTAWENADALDGGRAPGIGETTFSPRARVPSTIVVAGRGAFHLTLRVDGLPVEPSSHDSGSATFRFEAPPAEHHVVVMAGSAPVLATWVATAGPEAPAELAVDDAVLCQRDQFREIRRDGDRVVAPGVACPSWVAVASTEKPGAITVARCEGESCGPLLEWRVETFAPKAPAKTEPPRSRWPAWATWTLVGVGAAAVASTIVIASGAFESRPTVTRFVVGGARSE